MKAKKQNVFDDFIAAAEWLVANKMHVAAAPRDRAADRTAAFSSAPS